MMSNVYEETTELCKTLTETDVKHRLRCDKGQIRGGKLRGKLLEDVTERVRAFEDALSDEQEVPDSKVEYSDDVMFTLHVAKKYKQLFESARKRNKEFNLDLGDVRKLLSRKTCAYSGVVLTKGSHDKPTKESDMTIDRLDPEGGYVKGNVYAVSHAANAIKNSLFEHPDKSINVSVKEVFKMCDFLVKNDFKAVDNTDPINHTE